MNEEHCFYLKCCYLPPLVEHHNPLLNPLAPWKAITTPACLAPAFLFFFFFFTPVSLQFDVANSPLLQFLSLQTLLS